MADQQFAKDPLLYIKQPSLGKPTAPMQSSYSSSNSNQTAQKRRPRHYRKLINDKDDPIYEDTFEVTEEENHYIDEDNENSSQMQKKRYSELSLENKVKYFVDMPDYAPKIKCEIITPKKKYRGIIINYKDEHVFIRTGQRTTSVKVPFNDIKDIRMLGF